MTNPTPMRLAQLILGCALLAVPGRADAAPDTSAAAQAFANGQSAQLAGNHRVAAEQFELAHNIAPSVHALRSAARARYLANSYARAATHAVEILERYGDDTESVELADEILDATRDQLVEFEVECDAPCSLSKDGKSLIVDSGERHHFFTSPGNFELSAAFETGDSDPETFSAAPGKSYSASFTAPEAESIPIPVVTGEAAGGSTEPRPTDASSAGEDADKPKGSRRAHPAWFYGGLAATVAVGGVTLWSGLDTRATHQRFEEEPSEEAWASGRNKQLRTNILIGATAGIAAVTVVLAAFGTDWSKGRKGSKKRPKRTKNGDKDVAVWLGPLGVRGRF